MVHNQVADEVILGLLGAFLDQVTQVVEEALARSRGLTSSRAAVGANGVLVGQELKILKGDAEDGVDDLRLLRLLRRRTHVRGHWKCKLLHQVSGTVRSIGLDHLVEVAINRLLNVRPERLDVLAGEEALNHTPG